MTYTVLVCGGRDFLGKKLLCETLDRLNSTRPFGTLIHGGAVGVDALAGEWARVNNVTVEVFPANWKKYGKSAGPIRNAQMLQEGKPDLVVAFPGGKGTANMVKQAKDSGFNVVEVS